MPSRTGAYLLPCADLGSSLAARRFVDDRAIYVGLAAPLTVFVRICQTRFLLFRFRDLRLNFLRVTASMGSPHCDGAWPYDVLSIEPAGEEVSPAVPAPPSPASSPAPGKGSSPWLTGGASGSLRASRRARFWAAFSAFFRSRCRLAKVCWFFLAIRYEFASTRLLKVRAYRGRATPSITRSAYDGRARVSPPVRAASASSANRTERREP